MTAAIKENVAAWLERCSPDASLSIFDWFAALFDVCCFHGIANQLTSASQLLEVLHATLWREHGKSLAASLDDELNLTPPEVADAMRAALTNVVSKSDDLQSNDFQTLVTWVVMIDRIFSGLGVTLRSDSSRRVSEARIRLKELGTLTSSPSAWGHVLPKSASGEYGQSISRLCCALTYIGLSRGSEVQYFQEDEPFGLSIKREVTVAVIPTVQHADELDWKFSQNSDQYVYEVRLREDAERKVVARVEACLEAIKDKAHLVVLPELISSKKVVEAIENWLDRTRCQGRKLPIAVFAGTHLTGDRIPPFNMGAILAGSGKRCMGQYKLNPYTLKQDHRRDVDLLGAEPDVDYVENICFTPSITGILDITGLGRIVVTICEDLARWEPWRSLVLQAGPNLCLAPVMNGSNAGDWAIQAAINIANEAGTSVIVANSGALLGRTGRQASDYASAVFPRNKGAVVKWECLGEADVNADGHTDWFLYRIPIWPFGRT